MIIPNLPNAPVKKVIVSCEISENTEASIRKFGIEPFKLYGNMNVDEAVKNHPDMHFVHISNNTLLSSKNICSLAGEYISDFTYINSKPDNTTFVGYPDDAFLNCLVLGKYLICNTKCISNDVLKYSEEIELEVLHVNQGYTKCNICVVNKNSIITEDNGIASNLSEYGFRILLLKTNSVKIKKYKYGFIGGASGKISENKLAFFGDIFSHPEYDKIYRFLYKEDVEPVALTREPLTDYGSLMPIE